MKGVCYFVLGVIAVLITWYLVYLELYRLCAKIFPFGVFGPGSWYLVLGTFYLVHLVLFTGSWYMVVVTLHLGHVCQDLVRDASGSLYCTWFQELYRDSAEGSWYLELGIWNFTEACVIRPRYRCENYLVLGVFGSWYLVLGTWNFTEACVPRPRYRCERCQGQVVTGGCRHLNLSAPTLTKVTKVRGWQGWQRVTGEGEKVAREGERGQPGATWRGK